MEINRLAPSWLVLPMGGLPRPIVGLIGVHLPEILYTAIGGAAGPIPFTRLSTRVRILFFIPAVRRMVVA